MNRSCLWQVPIALVMLAGSACRPPAMPEVSDAPVPPNVHLGAQRTLSSEASLRNPVLLRADGDGSVDATFAVRRGGGMRVAVGAESLDVVGREAVTAPARDGVRPPPYSRGTKVAASLAGGRTLVAWIDSDGGRVLGQVWSAALEPLGAPFALSQTRDAVGSPVVRSPDGKHVVVAFFNAVDPGFTLEAATLEIDPPDAPAASHAGVAARRETGYGHESANAPSATIAARRPDGGPSEGVRGQ